MKMHKKGITVEVMLKVILMAVFIGILFFIFYQIYGVVTSGSEKQLCILSGVLESNKVSAAAGFKWECPIEKLDIEKKDISKKIEIDPVLKRTYKESKSTILQNYFTDLVAKESAKDNGELATYEFRLNQKIAKELQNCWEKTGEGEFDLGDAFTLPGNSKVYCAVCTRIKFKEDFLPGKNGGESLNEYLLYTPHPNPEKKSKYSGTRISLYEFLLDDTATAVFPLSFEYTTDKDYAVVYLRSNVDGATRIIGSISDATLKGLKATGIYDWYKDSWARALASAISGATSTGIPDPDKKGNYAIDAITLMPLDEVKDKCTHLLNYG